MKKAILLTLTIALLLATPSPATAANMSGIRKLVDAGRDQAALMALEELVAKDAENHEAWALLAEIRMALGDLKGAENAIVTALDLVEDKDPGYWKLLGRVSFERGIQAYSQRAATSDIELWFADAEVKFKRVFDMDPEDENIRCWMGWTQEWQTHPERARKLFDDQLKKFPKVAEGYLRLGNMLSQEANNTEGGLSEAAKKIRTEALAVFDEGLEKAGPDAEIYYSRGLALEWMGEKDKAIASYKSAVKVDPESDKAWRRMNKLGVPADKMIALAQAHPNSGTAAMWGAYYLLQQDRDVEALELALSALETHREHAGAYGQACGAAINLLGANPDLALSSLARLHELYEFSGSAANNLGLYYRDKGRYQESLSWYLKSLEREPLNQNILNDTALMYLFYKKGAEQKKCLPMLLKAVSLVQEDGYAPTMGYWDALENLSKYYWEVERNPQLVVKYATMRYETTRGVEPYNRSPKAMYYKKLAEKALGG